QLPAEHLTELSFGAGSLLVPQVPVATGSMLRLRIHARDVTIALDSPGRISANNVLPAVVTGLRLGANGEADVLLDTAGTKLLARITEYSARRLGLAVGVQAFAIIKSVTVDRGRGT